MLLLQAQLIGGRSTLRRNAGTVAQTFLWKQPEVQHAPLRRSEAPGISKAAFNRAVALVRLITDDLEASVQAWKSQSELSQLRGRLKNRETENTGLHEAARERCPEMPEATVQVPFNHAQKIVQEMITYIHQHYHRPMSLGDVAAALKMNSSYLSSLFSQTSGMTFHHYLEEFRMAKAKELLLDPHRRVCEVACVVGYASADQFRHAFNARVGFPPSAWR